MKNKHSHWDKKPPVDIENYEGFVYKITHKESGCFYIGRKSFWRRNKRGRKLGESNWRTYKSSCKPLKEDIKNGGSDNFTFEILHFCMTRKSLTYWELAEQFKRDVLLINSYNSNISGKFFPKDLNE